MTYKRKLIVGIGVNDVDYATQKTTIDDQGNKRKTVCPFYARWKHLLDRVYGEKTLVEYPTFRNNSVCEEWLYLSKFKMWMETQRWEGVKIHLDKDILVPGNRLYSPDTCAFIPEYLNNLFHVKASGRGEFPLGVSLRTNPKNFIHTKPYFTQCTMKGASDKVASSYSGSPEEAHRKWQQFKIIHIDNVIARYREEYCYRSDVENSVLLRKTKLMEDLKYDRETFIL